MAMKITVTSRLPGGQTERLAEAGHEVWIYEGEGAIPRETLLARATGANALLTLLTDKVDEELLAAAPGLKVVANYAVGYDNIDLAACRRHGVVATNTPDVLTEATADLTWALLLAAARRVVEGHKMTEAGEYRGWGPHLLIGQDVGGATLGIFGTGRIGRAVAKRALGFGMRLIYTDVVSWPEGEAELDAERVDFDTLLAESDFLSLHVPLLAATAKIMDRAAFAKMKPTAVFVNAARGGLVDEEALCHALTTGEIFAAGLDVYDPEPPDPANPLLSLPNVVLAPHTGSASVASRAGMARVAVENVLAVLAGQAPQTPVT